MEEKLLPPNLDAVDEVFDKETEVVSLFEAVKRLEAEKGKRDYFPTGLTAFDEVMWGGIAEGDLITISGRSGEGKTTLAQSISYQLAELGLPQLWFSYEMDLVEIGKKFKDMGAKDDMISYVPLKLASGSTDWIESRVKEAVLKYNTKVVFIDHLGFLAPRANGEQAERNLSIYLGQIARQLKMIARNQDVIVVLLAHTRKTREELDLDDIAYSGGIGQESDFVFLVERERFKPRRAGDIPPDGDKFGLYSKVLLAKNRRTGKTKFIKVEMRQGRLQALKPNNVLEQQLDEIIQ